MISESEILTLLSDEFPDSNIKTELAGKYIQVDIDIKERSFTLLVLQTGGVVAEAELTTRRVDDLSGYDIELTNLLDAVKYMKELLLSQPQEQQA